MVATRRKRAEALGADSDSEKDDPRLDADYTAQDDGGDDHRKIPLLDARTTADYKLYQGRLYVNCTTFPSP